MEREQMERLSAENNLLMQLYASRCSGACGGALDDNVVEVVGLHRLLGIAYDALPQGSPARDLLTEGYEALAHRCQLERRAALTRHSPAHPNPHWDVYRNGLFAPLLSRSTHRQHFQQQVQQQQIQQQLQLQRELQEQQRRMQEHQQHQLQQQQRQMMHQQQTQLDRQQQQAQMGPQQHQPQTPQRHHLSTGPQQMNNLSPSLRGSLANYTQCSAVEHTASRARPTTVIILDEAKQGGEEEASSEATVCETPPHAPMTTGEYPVPMTPFSGQY